MIVCATLKYDVPELRCQHSGFDRILIIHLWDIKSVEPTIVHHVCNVGLNQKVS